MSVIDQTNNWRILNLSSLISFPAFVAFPGEGSKDSKTQVSTKKPPKKKSSTTTCSTETTTKTTTSTTTVTAAAEEEEEGDIVTPSTEIDTGYYYLLKNVFAGDDKALDILLTKTVYLPQMKPISSESSQQWYFVAAYNGSYRIQNHQLGEGFSLDVIPIEPRDKVRMAGTGEYFGQYWTLHPSKDGSYRLYNEYTTQSKFLDISSDNFLAHLSDATKQYLGQQWHLEKLSPIENS